MTIHDFTSRDTGFTWTTTPYSDTALKEIPYIEMIGYQQDWSSVVGSINNWYTRITERRGNPYQGLYLGTKKAEYKLPFLSDYHHEVSQSWGEASGALGPWVTEAIKTAVAAARTALPAAGVLAPFAYEGQAFSEFTFSFDVINTNAGNGHKDEIAKSVMRNMAFIHSFTSNNLHSLEGALTIMPPLIYEFYIPGIRYCPAGVVQRLSIKNKGSMNLNTQGIIPGATAEYTYPDAWEITVTMQELIKESRLTYGEAITGKPRLGGVGGGAQFSYRAIDGGGS